MKKKENDFLKSAIVILLPILICVGGYYIYDNYIKRPGIPSVNKLIDEKKKNNYQDRDDNKRDVSNYSNPLPGYRSEYGNDDIVGRLEIPNLNIDALITRTTNNDYYLNYNLYRQYDAMGVPFFDYRNTDLNTNSQINIYGHNTPREDLYEYLPFTNLEAYVDRNIFDNYKDVYLSIDERQMHYEVYAIKILPDSSNNEHMKLSFNSNVEYLQHLNALLSNTLYRSNESVSASDRFLVLQICHYDPDGSYLLVICKEKK